MTNKDIIELLEQYKNLLLSSATGGNVIDEEFSEVRLKLISNPVLKDKLPSFVKVYRTPREFFSYMQSMFEHYKERREYITQQINPIL